MFLSLRDLRIRWSQAISMDVRAAQFISRTLPMSYDEYKVSIYHKGREYCVAYKIYNDIVSVVMKDRDDSHRETSTFIDRFNAEAVSSSLLGELLKDMDFH